ncbi:MmgE/PrpD family protein [Bradyrhizobium sp. SZCCHNPS2010]|uniref:MmgE/PrpD family protein n=1 Tax=Bradyrhizobium sp. SZCCHNPS2010 TaxID=3057333 RepID=UPI002915F8C3|nr:MmgE/PrpD family protein [Bradyrhizobium sp. SZCCHNPS2010]
MSEEARGIAREALVDYVGCAIAGSQHPSIAQLYQVLAPAPGPAAVIGHRGGVDALTAALINGHSGHALDYDDVHASVRGHTSTVIFPSLLACAARLSVEGRRPSARLLLDASVVGVEIMGRLGLALGPDHYEQGFHATATLGAIGAAAACARLMGLGEEEAAIAIGLAATQSSGLRAQFGSDGKPLHAGLAARNGLLSALLARTGFQGAKDALDGPNGYLSVFKAGIVGREGWGRPWQIISPGLLFKAFPSCTASHGAAVAALALRRELGSVPLAAIETITATFPPGGDAALVVRRPETGSEGRFSAEYVIAIALLRGALTLPDFDDRPIADDARALLAKVERRHDTTAPRLSGDPSTRFIVVTIRTSEGIELSKRFDGLPRADSLDDKFADLARGSAYAPDLITLIRTMDTGDDLQTFLDALQPS